MKTLKVKASVQIPSVPNFLKYNGGTISIADISNEDLIQVAKAWQEEIIATAERIRTQKHQEEQRAVRESLK